MGVARLYAPWAATLVIDAADAARADEVEAEGMRCVVTDTVMSSPEKAAMLGAVVLDPVFAGRSRQLAGTTYSGARSKADCAHGGQDSEVQLCLQTTARSI